jgi:hypothetical protein
MSQLPPILPKRACSRYCDKVCFVRSKAVSKRYRTSGGFSSSKAASIQWLINCSLCKREKPELLQLDCYPWLIGLRVHLQQGGDVKVSPKVVWVACRWIWRRAWIHNPCRYGICRWPTCEREEGRELLTKLLATSKQVLGPYHGTTKQVESLLLWQYTIVVIVVANVDADLPTRLNWTIEKNETPTFCMQGGDWLYVVEDWLIHTVT